MTMTPTDTARRTKTPPLQGRGRGWGIDAETLATLKRRAREMRGQPTEPEKFLWRNLSGRQLGGAKFRRQAVLPPFIVDFLCPAERLVIEVDGDTHAVEADAERDAALAALGYRVLRFTNEEVMRNMDGVLAVIASAFAQQDSPHPNPSPEGEGLAPISLEGSVG